MKRLFLMGRSEAGKTSLTQALRGEKLHYHKTQYTYADGETIDTPGEYAESKQAGVGLACFSFESDVVAILIAANEPFTVHAPNANAFLNRPLIGVITKIHAPNANIPMVRQWLVDCGCERVFLVDNSTGEGVGALRAYLAEDNPRISLEEAKERQRMGLSDWAPLPQGA
ncbi:EutP/PduV family microcompartment system protein [Olsenella sp. DNF00959]|uniref:EutP/PduV family microcompartment system protein n=1 Tax=Olsenella TaxID=133925 RepID=UPI0007810D00|nr:EutP/PduV family microcompartment system protein [Olsenella sp. DNF00959]KXB62433.1 putative ethanolamine utilization protein, EutP [Olsenella sp. DNF00959]